MRDDKNKNNQSTGIGMDIADFMNRDTHEMLDLLFDQAVDLWDCEMGSEEEDKLSRLLDQIETFDRELYPDYWEERDSDAKEDEENKMDPNVFEHASQSTGNISELRGAIVEIGQQWLCQDTLTVKLEGLLPVAMDYHMLIPATEEEVQQRGYLGQYSFVMEDGATKSYHVLCPELCKIE